MFANIRTALAYWARATFEPRRAISALITRENKVAIALRINLIFAVLYAATALIYYAIGRLPAVTPWMPVPVERYYLYQTFWTVPWGLVTWIAFSGVAHLLGAAGSNRATQATFENALVACGLAWVVPSMILMWIPETLLVPLLGVFWPDWLETLRLMVIPPVWQSLLVALGLRETHRVGWLRGIVIGIITVVVFFISFLAYMR